MTPPSSLRPDAQNGESQNMLETSELNVSEVAIATGYSCFGHFAEAFRKRFGVTPEISRKGGGPEKALRSVSGWVQESGG